MRQARGRRYLGAVMLAALLSLSVFSFAEGGQRSLKSKYSPAYPEIAKKMRVAGTVKVELVVAANGQVRETKVIGGHPVLVQSAVEAVKKWRYEPAAAESRELVEINFDPNRQ